MEELRQVVEYLKAERPTLSGLESLNDFDTYRALVNMRQPLPIDENILKLQDVFLQKIIAERGITNSEDFEYVDNITLWQGDISSLKVGAIVNAANSALLGCFYPLHACIDNVIQTYAGIQLRLACNNIMETQGHNEATGLAKITPAFNLPSDYVLHTVGPIISHSVRDEDRRLLASCYTSCLKLAEKNNVKSVAFCCISTGEFRFPKVEAAHIAVKTVKEYLNNNNLIKVIFNVFTNEDRIIYEQLLKK